MSDAKIVDSWRKNASAWTDAVRESQIASRTLVTNGAIVDAVLSRAPATAVDVGCGEGWLVRALAEHGIVGLGVDVVPSLIEHARRAGGGEFRVASYEQIAAGELDTIADVVVANFSLIGKESVDALLARVPDLLTPRGSLVIQTLHPVVVSDEQPYADGWRAGSWTGFGAEFTDPAPWYFRTLESWVRSIVSSGLHVEEIREPMHPRTGKPASVIFIAAMAG